jgi:PAS domain S-box-containing protein
MVIRDKKTSLKGKRNGVDFLPLVARISSLALSQARPERITRESLAGIRRAFRADACWLFRFWDDKVKLTGTGWPKALQAKAKAYAVSALSPEAVSRSYPIVCNRIGEIYSSNRALYRFLRTARAQKFVGVLLKKHGRPTGALSVSRGAKSPHFTRANLKSLGALSAVLSLMQSKGDELSGGVAQSLLDALIDSIPSPIFVKDRKHRWVLLNRASAQLAGFDREQMLGKSDHDFFPKEQADFFWKKDEEMFRTGKVINIPEEPITDGEGGLHYLHTRKAPLRDASGKITHLVGIMEDITLRRQMEKTLADKERIVRERARLLADLRKLDDVDRVLTRVCEAVRDSGLFERAVMTLHKPGGKIFHMGQVGLPSNVVKRARQAPPIDRKLKARLTSERFRISDSFFVPAEAGLDLSKSARHIPQKKAKLDGGDWRVGDELFVPLRDFSGQTMGYLSVDTSTDGCRPDLKTSQALETLVEAAASRVREIEIHQALIDERDFSQSILETANSMILCLDAEAKITMFNRECERVTGYRRKEVLGKRWPDLFLPPDKRHQGLESFADWVRDHPRDQYEGQILTKTGIRTILWSNTSIIGSDKNDVTAIAIGHDITERKKTEEALQSSEQTARALLNASPEIALLVNPDGTILALSEATAKNLGKDAGELIGTCAFDLFEPQIAARRRAMLKKAVRSGRPVRFEDERGTRCWDSNVYPVFDERGKVVRLAVFAYEITERRRTERALRDNESRYRVLFEESPVSLWEEDFSEVKSYIDALRDSGSRDFRAYFERHPKAVFKCASLVKVIDVNKASLKLYGARNKEELISNFGKILAEESYIPFREELISIAEGKTTFEAEAVTLDLKGKRNYVVVRWTVAPGCEQSLSKVLVTVVDISERKTAEQKVQQERKRLFSVLDTMPAFVYLQAPDYSVPFVNRTFRELFGDPGDLPCYQAFYGRSKPCEPCITFKVLSSKTPQTYEWTSKDGRTYVVHEHPLAGIGGTEMVLGTGIDITEHKQAKEALQKGEEKYRLLVENLTDMIVKFDTDGRLLFVSPSYCKTFGVSEEEILGKKFMPLIHEDDQGYVEKALADVYKPPHVVYVQERAKTAKGWRWQAWINTAVLDESRKVAHIVAVGRDITQLKQAEDALRRQEEQYRTLVETAHEGIGICDPKENLVFVNRAFADLLGYKREELIGVNLKDLSEQSQYSIFKKETAKRRKGRASKYEATLVTKSGKPKPVYVSAAPLWNDDGSFKGTLGVLSDLTEIKKVREYNILLDTSRSLSRSLRCDQVLKLGAEKMIQALNADRCSVMLTENGGSGSAVKVQVFAFGRKKADSTSVWEVRTTKEQLSSYEQSLRARAHIEVSTSRTNPAPDLAKRIIRKAGMTSALAVPIFQRNRLMGVLHVGMIGESRAFDADQVRLSLTMANQVGAALQNCRLMEDLKGEHFRIIDQAKLLKAQFREQKMMFELTQTLTSARNLDQLLRSATRKVVEILRTERSSVALVNPDGVSTTIRAVYPQVAPTDPEVVGITFTPDVFPQLKQILVRKKPLLFPDISKLPKADLARKYFLPRGLKSTVAVPLISRGKVLGFLTVGTLKEVHPYTKDEIRLLQTISNAIGVAVENYQLLEDLKQKYAQIEEQATTLRKQTREKDILLKLGQALSRSMDLNELSQVASRVVGTELRVERCAISLPTADGAEIEIRGLFRQGQADTSRLLGTRFSWQDFPAYTKIIKTGRPWVIAKTSDLPRGSGTSRYFLKQGIKSVLGAGMFFGKKLVGILSITSVKEHRIFSQEEIKLVQTIANQIAVAIENARLLEMVEKHGKDVRRLAAQLMSAQEDARRSVAQELHDHEGQMLLSMKMNLDKMKRHLTGRLQKVPAAVELLMDTQELLSQTIDDIRTLTFELRPPVLEDFGLTPALRWILENFAKRTDVSVSLRTRGEERRYPREVEVALFRIAQEALNNVSKHANATDVTILVSYQGSGVTMSLRDNGAGFDADKVLSAPRGSMGLLNIKERADMLGGKFEIISQPRKGTTLNINIPSSEVKHEED